MRQLLNQFQKTMLQWNHLHPYNAIHGLRLPKPVDPQQLQTSIHQTLEAKRLTQCLISPNQSTINFTTNPSPTRLTTLDTTGDSPNHFSQIIARELNTPFTHSINQPFTPFRFLLINQPSSSWLCLTYFHAVADAHAILQLLRDIVTRHHQPNTNLPPATPPANNPESLLTHHPLSLLRALLTLPSTISTSRRCHRPKSPNPDASSNLCSAFTLPPDLLQQLRLTSRSWQVTINDLLLTALLKAVAPFTPSRLNNPKRPLLGLGVIVSLRNDLPNPESNPFGLLLGSFRVAHPTPNHLPLENLAKQIHQQTQSAKQHRSYHHTPIHLTAARLLTQTRPPRKQTGFYPKNHPLCGGITNLNLDPIWPHQDYFRAVSTGPATPLVLSATTANQNLQACLTSNSSVFDANALEQVKSTLQATIQELHHGR
jgi:hypothetical protein